MGVEDLSRRWLLRLLLDILAQEAKGRLRPSQLSFQRA